MKILVVRVTGGFSGAENYTLLFLKAFEKYKDVELVFLSNFTKLTSSVIQLGGEGITIPVPVGEIGTKKHFLKAVVIYPYYLLLYIFHIRKLEKNGKFNILIFESMTEKIFLTPIMKLLGYKIIWIEHGPLYITQRAALIKFFYTIVSNITDKIIAISQDTKKDLETGRVNTKKIMVIYPWIELTQFIPLSIQEKGNLRNQHSITKNVKVVSFLSKVNHAKGITEFIKVASLLLNKNHKVHFIVIGDGEEKQWAKNEVKKRQIGYVFTFVPFSDENIRNYLGITDVLFFPTKHIEGTPTSLLQAMSMETIILAHDIGGVSEIIINGKTGFTYTNESLTSIRDKVITLFDEKYTRFGRNARTFLLEKFNEKAITHSMYALFKTTV